MITVVHAQSPRRIERCAELGREPSDGESAFPRGCSLIRVHRKRKGNHRFGRRDHKFVRIGTWHPPRWKARRAVGEGVKFCPRAGCGKSACPVVWTML